MTTAISGWQLGSTNAPLPKQVPGLPFVGIAHKLNRDPLGFFLSLYHQHGSIFRVKVLSQEITVLAGLNANKLLGSDGNRILSSEPLFGSFAREMGTEKFLVSIDGEEHLHMRKQMKDGYSRSAMLPHTDKLIQIIDDFTRTLRPGDTFAILPTLQYLVTQQLGIVIANRTPDDYFADLQRFLNYALNVHVLKYWPRFMLKMPAFQNSKKRAFELAQEVLNAHRQNRPAEGAPRNLINDILDGKDFEGKPYDEDFLIASTIGPYFAGIDTVASSMAFLLYAVLKNRIDKHITSEADDFFSTSGVDLFKMKDMEWLHGASIEGLRMYPVAPFSPRRTTEPFEFEGHRVNADSDVYFAQTLTHFLPEYFPEPYTFDALRFSKKKPAPGTFAPFTLGAHLCLGAGIAETQLMLITARLLHNLQLELETPNETMTIYATPLPNLGAKMKVRVVENRAQKRS